MESTDTTSKDHRLVDPRLEPLTNKILGGECTVEALQELRALAKGNDWAKGFIGERLSSVLMQIIKSRTPSAADSPEEVFIEVAKLLRSITVCRKNKTLGSECSSIIIKVLATTDNRSLKLALTATLWNLSALAENRGIIVKHHGLEILSELLESGDLGLQREAAGALRNITLDDECKEAFSSAIIDTLVQLLGKTDDMQLLVCICGALRNLADTPQNRKWMATEKCIDVMCGVLKSDNTKLQNLTLTVLCKVCQESTSHIYLGKKLTKELYDMLLNSNVQNVRENTLALLDTLNNDKPQEEQTSTLGKDESGNATLKPDVFKTLNLDSNITYTDITLLKKIGEGQYGDVWMAKYHEFPVACKILKKTMSSKEAEKALEELRLMAKLKHPNVVLLMGACLNDQQQICIVTEYASRGDLRNVAPQVKSLTQRLKLGLDIASGLAWMHANDIVHRDLKLPNLLVFEDLTVKVADFGLSIQLEEGVSINRFGGNVKYSAPEILKARYDDSISTYPYSEKTDVYSYGLMLWELITLKPLFIRPKEFKGKKGLAKYVLAGYRPALEKHWPQSLNNLLASCWHQDPSKRPPFRDIISQWSTLTTDILCPDKLGHEVCRKLFVQQDTVTFEEFLHVFAETCFENPVILHSKKIYRKYLLVLLCETSFDDTVTKNRFCNVVGWFAPIDKSDNCTKFFGRMKDLFSRRYFHGFLSESKAENQLKQLWESNSNKQSYYVVRFSESEVGGFVLTFIDFIGHIQHEKITNKNGSWYVEGICEEFDSWSKVKQAFKQVWNVGYHLSKSPYTNLFKKGVFGNL